MLVKIKWGRDVAGLGKYLWLALFLIMPAAANAEWKEAVSRNFIVYSEGPDEQLREFTAKLEKFNFVLRAYHRVTAPPASNKLRVFLLPTIETVGRMAGSNRVAGYYVRDSRGLMMVGTASRGANSKIDSESILLHEYTHHFMYQYFPATYPTWYSEGFAEFWGSTDILDKDVVEIGLPAEHRFGSFFSNRWLAAEKLLTARSYADVPDLDLLYAEGWLLVRYGFENPERGRQLQAYLQAINRGASYEAAMKGAFPDVAQLNSELFSYAGRSKFNVLRLPFKAIDVGDIALRKVTPAEDALMEHEIQMSQGILQREAAEFAGKVRASASRFPDDPFALRLLAEAEQLAGNSDAARAALDRLLKLVPNHPRGLMERGEVELAALKASGSKDTAAWQAARQYLVRANRASPKDPLILEAYYDSFADQGVLPPESAQNALYSAMELAPSDSDLRFKLAADFEQRNMIPEAIAIIRATAFTLPHRKNESESQKKRREEREEKYRRAGDTRRETAREMLERLEKKLGQSKKA